MAPLLFNEAAHQFILRAALRNFSLVGRKVKRHAKLLERCFSRQEWEYLKRNEKFKEQLQSANETLADFERLCLLGDRLLRASERANPGREPFHRVGTEKNEKQNASRALTFQRPSAR